MSDYIDPKQFHGEGAKRVEEKHREVDVKLQQYGKQLLTLLYMLIRTVKIHDPDNAIFEKPLMQMRDVINSIINKDGVLNLILGENVVYLNSGFIKLDISTIENLKYVSEEMKARDLGGFVVEKPVTIEELKNFIFIFSKNLKEEIGEEGSQSRRLVSIKMSKYKKIKELLSGMEIDSADNIKIDRKKYSMVVYARSIQFVKSYIDYLRGVGNYVQLNQGIRMVRDLVELYKTDSQNFIGVSTIRSEEDYLYYHSVNTAMMNIIIGLELGLNKEQLTDCAMLGFIHDIGKIKVSENILNKKGPLTPAERQEVAKIPLYTIKLLLHSRTLDKNLIDRIIAISEYNIDFAKSLKNPDEVYKNPCKIVKSPIGIYSRILSISHVYDALTSDRPWRSAFSVQDALKTMVVDMKTKFDPFILGIFIRLMRYYVVRNLSGVDISIT
ncbi:MAG: hypothetical protein N2746_06145 [Deltaproteobacteria bacterium]|nr:hypothetical protein [Deltaproteobacteria bacterium]